MKDKILSFLKQLADKAKPILHKGAHHGTHHAKVAAAGLAGLYWNLSPQNRYRVRLAAFAFAILSVGIVVGRLTNVNRAVKYESSGKELKVQKSGVLELTLPGIQLNPEIYIFQSAEKVQVPVDIKVPGRLAFNAEKSKVLSARAPGRVERIYAFDGAQVDIGSPIVEMYSPEFLSAQQEYLLSSKTAKVLEANKSMSDLLGDARITQQAAANRMRNLGAGEGDIKSIETTGKTTNNLIMRSPLKGVVVKRNVEPGSAVSSGDVIATLADPKQLWFLGNVFEQDFHMIKQGQKMILTLEAYPEKQFVAYANYIAPAVDPQTRALLIRADVENTDDLLRPDMYASALLTTGMADAVVVPQTAIVRVRETRYAIIKVGPEKYRRVPVKGYDLNSKSFAITEGIEQGWQILAQGAVLLNDRFAKQED
ncbi:efflux RND transporter periplasmic adaptor subunit [Polynucleobacter sp. AP-Capit-er-40B-B4]|uniref:efflux RND transporter periplasmic adaptor subunit n=1 Tax=Polynucleobacter sp. AP-Capit-er-40B-B4 TaxID=2576927 RepID=UPI001C0C4F75|nr:efflux RND transporter periplasmic adaptor subunit [Polynucleobacter sp. AP-Capit-er-40B-B4]MBU3580602.1 efflux RND transporter periplasmic adaptor subunit [Polynucleobacter sp. AP-Capit-er-40B-B4]